MRHRGARISRDFGSVAELATVEASRLSYELLRRDLSIGRRSGTVSSLPSSRENDGYENSQNDEQQQR